MKLNLFQVRHVFRALIKILFWLLISVFSISSRFLLFFVDFSSHSRERIFNFPRSTDRRLTSSKISRCSRVDWSILRISELLNYLSIHVILAVWLVKFNLYHSAEQSLGAWLNSYFFSSLGRATSWLNVCLRFNSSRCDNQHFVFIHKFSLISGYDSRDR